MYGMLIPIVGGLVIGLLTHIIIKISKDNPRVKRVFLIIALCVGAILVAIMIFFLIRVWIHMNKLNS